MILPLVSCDKSMTYNDQTAASPSLISGGGYFPRTRLRLFRQQASKGPALPSPPPTPDPGDGTASPPSIPSSFHSSPHGDPISVSYSERTLRTLVLAHGTLSVPCAQITCHDPITVSYCISFSLNLVAAMCPHTTSAVSPSPYVLMDRCVRIRPADIFLSSGCVRVSHRHRSLGFPSAPMSPSVFPIRLPP